MPAGLAIVFALGFGGLFTALAVLIGPKASTPDKLKPFDPRVVGTR
jgi:NADH:ubiquinone oxidoreductase subunit 3 (subunit A)